MTKTKPKANLEPFYQGRSPAEFADSLQSSIDLDFPTGGVDVRKLMFVAKNWQMTPMGFSLLSERYEYYRIKIPSLVHMTGHILLNLDRSINGPWMVTKKDLYLFDSVAAFTIEMSGGDIMQYIEFQAPKNQLT